MTDSRSPPPPRRRVQFSLRSLLLLAVICSVSAATLAGMLGLQRSGVKFPPGFFVVMAAAAPLAVMVVLGLIRAMIRWLARRKR